MATSTNQFTYDKAGKKFIAEISDTEGFESHIGPNCLGLSLKSSKTGCVSEWAVVSKKVVDGELQFWTLRPTEDTMKKHPQLRGFEMILFND